MKNAVVILFCVIACAPVAYAETAADQSREALMKSCMGTSTAQQDPERAEYCNCVRNSMASWSDQDFNDVAAQASKAHSAGEEPPKLQEVAKACITKVLGAMPQ